MKQTEPLLVVLLDEPQPEPTLNITGIDDADQPAELTALKQLDSIAFNAAAEELFLELICRLLTDGELTVREAIVETSFELNVSPETAKRYVTKHSARRARFALIEGQVTCKIHRHPKGGTR